ncbi:uncharacterized protein LOC132867510 [Neoarius graeffei]|uniref:uncharacterized protein LOC132867510 n=1 Tax=Neoarius graeffei TaxID=443677 RepID=UPI00298C1623|nr:uncharacterized protein LOC132867510 [Neoarius graeffei]XP_060756449.1 uncharacterized protein LOC132867510 [Neoarius graeffei]
MSFYVLQGIKVDVRGGITKSELQVQFIDSLYSQGVFGEVEKVAPEPPTTSTKSSLEWKRLALRERELEWEQTKLREQREHELNINFTREDVSGNNLAFLDCDVHIRQDRSLSIEVYRKPTHTDQYLLFDSHHPLEHKLGVIRTLQHRAQNIPTTVEGKEKEQNHIRKALQNCGYPNWSFFKSRKRNIMDKEDNRNKRKNIVIPYISGLSEKLRRIFYKHNIPVCFRPSNTLKQKLVHPKDRIPRHKQDNVVYAIQCSEQCTDSYIGETKQPLHRRMAQHRRASSSGQDSAVYLHLNNKGHSFQDSNVRILAREDCWYERGVKEAIFVNLERPSLNRGGGLRHNLSATYNAVLGTLPRQLNAHQNPAVFSGSQEDRENQHSIDHLNGQSIDHPNDSRGHSHSAPSDPRQQDDSTTP